MNDLINKKCPNCSATISFDIEKGKATCEYCGSEFSLDLDSNVLIERIRAQ